MRAAALLVLPLSSTIVAGSGLLSCRRAGDERPMVALATSPAAEARFVSVRLRWISANRVERAAMRTELTEIERWLEKQQDGLEPVARAYLAIAWLDADVPNAAEAVARPLYEGPPGVTHDLGVLVRGIALRRSGKSAEAIEVLKPIVGKLIDPFARPLLDEEMTEALIDEQRYDEAIAFTQAWLRAGATSDRKALHENVARVLHRIPVDVARRTIDAQRSSKGTAGYSPELMLILGARLDDFDEQLIELDGGVALAGDGGAGFDAASLELYGDASTVVTLPLPVRFDPRAIALLVPTTAAGHGANATAAVRGATSVVTEQSLPTPTKSAGDAGLADTIDATLKVLAPSAASHHLGVFDTGGTALGTLKAMDAAERNGAAVVIGGITDAESNALALMAQTKHVPTVLLRAPTAPPKIGTGERAFFVVLGPSTADEAKVTLSAAQNLAGVHAVVDPYPETNAPEKTADGDPLRVRCDAMPQTASSTAFPIAQWRASKVTAVVILGDARCANRIARELTEATPPYRPQLVLGPAAMELVHETWPLARMALGGGQLPADDGAPIALQRLWSDQRAPVGWWTGFGHDAATLAMSATPGDLLPTIESDEIQKARLTTLDRLVKASGELWSTEARAPGAGGVVARTVFVRSIGAGGGPAPSLVGRRARLILQVDVAQVRGSWFPNVRSALDHHGILAATEQTLAMTTHNILWSADPQKWFDEGHAVAIYEAVAKVKGIAFCREVGRDAARFAMASTWHELMQALLGHMGGTPRMAFEHLPVLWNATRRGGGDVFCLESSGRHAVTEVRGFPYTTSPAWVQVWLGHHDALFKHLRFVGHCELLSDDVPPEAVRVRATWTSVMRGAPSHGFGGSGSGP